MQYFKADTVQLINSDSKIFWNFTLVKQYRERTGDQQPDKALTSAESACCGKLKPVFMATHSQPNTVIMLGPAHQYFLWICIQVSWTTTSANAARYKICCTPLKSGNSDFFSPHFFCWCLLLCWYVYILSQLICEVCLFFDMLALKFMMYRLVVSEWLVRDFIKVLIIPNLPAFAA